MDRIVHPEIENFKALVYGTEFCGMKIGQWNKLLASRRDQQIKVALKNHLEITEENIDELLD